MVSFKKLRQMIGIQGNGKIVVREIGVSSFIRLHLGVKGTVELIQSNEEKVEVETDENLMEYVTAVNAGRTLYVSTEEGLRHPVFTKILVKVYFRQIDNLRNCCSGDVRSIGTISYTAPFEVKLQCEGDTDLDLDVPSLKLKMQCEGDVTLKGKCNILEIKDQADGNLMCREMKAANVSLINMSEGNIEIYADESVTIKHMGQGTIHYYGPGRLKDIIIMGEGEVKHMD